MEECSIFCAFRYYAVGQEAGCPWDGAVCVEAAQGGRVGSLGGNVVGVSSQAACFAMSGTAI